MPDGRVWSQPPTCPYICLLFSSFLPSQTPSFLLACLLAPPSKPHSVSPSLPFSPLVHRPPPHTLFRQELHRIPPPSSPPQCPSIVATFLLHLLFLLLFPPASAAERRCRVPLRAFPRRRGRCPSSPPWRDAGSAGPGWLQDSRPYPGNGSGCCGGLLWGTMRVTRCVSSVWEKRLTWSARNSWMKIHAFVFVSAQEHAATQQAQKGLMRALEEAAWTELFQVATT